MELHRPHRSGQRMLYLSRSWCVTNLRTPFRALRSCLRHLPLGGANVTFNGSPAVTTDAAGIATSPTMTANLVIGLIAPVATTPGAALPAVFALANTAGPATRLVFVQQPTNTTAGAAIAPPVTAQLLDAAGNLARVKRGVTVTVQLSPAGRRIQHGVRACDAKHRRGRRGYVRRSRCRTGGYVPVTGAIRGASIGNQHIVRHRRRDFVQHHCRGRQQSVGCRHDELCHPAQSRACKTALRTLFPASWSPSPHRPAGRASRSWDR